MRVSVPVMIGGLGIILAREKVFSRFNALALLLYSHDVTEIVHASLWVIPLAFIERFRVRNWIVFGSLLPSM